MQITIDTKDEKEVKLAMAVLTHLQGTEDAPEVWPVSSQPVATEKPEAAGMSPQAEGKTETKPALKEPEVEVTKPMLQVELKRLIDAGKRKAVTNLFSQYDSAKLSEVAKTDYPALLADLKGMA